MTRLPDFVIAGTMKSGTSSLATWLAARDDVHGAPGKEIHFFNADANYARGRAWYAQMLAAPADVPLAFEATPLYAFFPEAVERMAAMLPGAKVIVCLRDPVERAHSHYRHFWNRRASERRSFASAVERELAADPLRPGEVGPAPYEWESHRYVAQGVYLPQLERLAAAFGRDRLHVVLMEDLQASPQAAFGAVCDFLGVPREPVPAVVGERVNAHFEYRPVRLWRWLVRHRALERLPDRAGRFVAVELMRRQTRPVPMGPDVRARLAAFYAPHNEALAAWLGEDLARWAAPYGARTVNS